MADVVESEIKLEDCRNRKARRKWCKEHKLDWKSTFKIPKEVNERVTKRLPVYNCDAKLFRIIEKARKKEAKELEKKKLLHPELFTEEKINGSNADNTKQE